MVDYLDPEILTQYIEKLEYARVYAEPVYEKTEEYMRYVTNQL
jgi:hypothetical protein